MVLVVNWPFFLAAEFFFMKAMVFFTRGKISLSKITNEDKISLPSDLWLVQMARNVALTSQKCILVILGLFSL